MIEAAIFDLDGVLIDSEPLWRRGEVACFAEVGLTLTEDDCRETTGLRMEEVAARGGRIVLITDKAGARASGGSAFETIEVPDAHPFIAPMLYAVPVQLLAYHAAVFRGTDVDQPRNLAKSVTVE